MLHVSVPMGTTDDAIRTYRETLRTLAFEVADEHNEALSVTLPETGVHLETSLQCVQQMVTANLRYHIVVGIGGSNLGTKAIYDALFGQEDSLALHLQRPKLLFAESIDARWLYHFRKHIVPALSRPEQVLVSIISKSGNTTETIANAEIILHDLEACFERAVVMSRVVIISDEGSALWQYAQDNTLAFLPIPAKVGGRYSVLSNVGLFPLATVGVDVSLLLKGAQEVLGWYLTGDVGDDQALRTATYISNKYLTGRMIHDSFYFEPALESLGKWQRQLIGESIGKSHLVGITPTVSIGTTDLHSVGQLYLAGPHQRMTEFVFVSNSSEESIPRDRFMPNLLGQLDGKDAHTIMRAVITATKSAYESGKHSFYEVNLDEIDAWHLGAYMQYKMLTVMYAAKLLNVNAFDQPAVEGYKQETRAILES